MRGSRSLVHPPPRTRLLPGWRLVGLAIARTPGEPDMARAPFSPAETTASCRARRGSQQAGGRGDHLHGGVRDILRSRLDVSYAQIEDALCRAETDDIFTGLHLSEVATRKVRTTTHCLPVKFRSAARTAQSPLESSPACPALTRLA
jgi:hypothetical protein